MERAKVRAACAGSLGRAVLGVFLWLFTALPATAGFQEVLAAFERRDYVTAQYLLATAYRDGRGVPRDAAEALTWFRRAAEHGMAEAQVELGVMAHLGDGVALDDTAALEWFRRAAEQSLAAGQNNLGTMYDLGRGVSQDQAEAARWYRLAAEQGLADGQFNLAAMYEYGLGVTHDPVRAYALYASAALGGRPGRAREQAERGRARMAARLDEGQLATAVQLIQRWRPESIAAVAASDAESAEPADAGTEDQVEAEAPPAGTEAVARPLDTAAQITAYIQRPLLILGYDTGPLDGQLGPRTKAAIREFEASRGLPVTGGPSERLAIELLASRLDRWVRQNDAMVSLLGR